VEVAVDHPQASAGLAGALTEHYTKWDPDFSRLLGALDREPRRCGGAAVAESNQRVAQLEDDLAQVQGEINDIASHMADSSEWLDASSQRIVERQARLRVQGESLSAALADLRAATDQSNEEAH